MAREIDPRSPERRTYAINEAQLAAADLPQPRLYKERTLIADVEGHEVGVAVYALPPRESRWTEFWNRLGAKRGKSEGEEVGAARLRINPPIDEEDFRPGYHTELSGELPHVPVEDGTRYAVAIIAPRGLFTDWSEPQERDAKPDGKSIGFALKGEREVYQERAGVSVTVRVDGETPLNEVDVNGELVERWVGYSPLSENESDDQLMVLGQRVVSKPSLFGGPEQRGRASDLVFEKTADAGTLENMEADDSGLVQVIVAETTYERVIERIHPPIVDTGYGDNLRSISFGGSPLMRSLPGATEIGRTSFGGSRRTKVAVTQDTVVGRRPIAEFKFAMVGDGGPLEMQEADLSDVQQKKQ